MKTVYRILSAEFAGDLSTAVQAFIDGWQSDLSYEVQAVQTDTFRVVDGIANRAKYCCAVTITYTKN